MLFYFYIIYFKMPFPNDIISLRLSLFNPLLVDNSKLLFN
jgi:hypothetical protein